MPGFGFHTLALLTAIGLAGPLLAALPRLRMPVIIGELIAGLVVGRTGLGIVDVTNPTFQLLANIGFALVMFVVGTHVPVRAGALRSSLPQALARAALGGAVAAGLGAGLAAIRPGSPHRSARPGSSAPPQPRQVSGNIGTRRSGSATGATAAPGDPRRLPRFPPFDLAGFGRGLLAAQRVITGRRHRGVPAAGA